MARCALLLAACLGLVSAERGVSVRGAHQFVKALSFKHSLRVCNAYPYTGSLDVYLGKTEKLTEEAMAYKTCRDFKAPIKAGDKLEFRVGDANAGTFSVSDLPNNDAILLLVIFRHDTLSTAVSFESHVFASLLNAQVAVIDTYKGASKSVLKIKDHSDAKLSRAEQLRYDSVVAVNPGRYEVSLIGADGEEKADTELVALNKESYVLLRVGVEAQQGPSYPAQLVVFPQSDAKMLEGSALSQFAMSMAAVALPIVAMLM